MINMELYNAVKSLCPDASFCLRDGVLEWHDDVVPQPSDKQIQDEIGLLGEIKEENQYRVDRAAAYPSIGDQLDFLWHAMDSKEIPVCSIFYNAIKAIKDANPKPR